MANKINIGKIVKLSTLKPWDKNPREITSGGMKLLKKYLKKYDQLSPLKVTKDGEILRGNHRYKAMNEMNWENVWVLEVNPKTDAEKLEIALIDNQEFANYVESKLSELIIETPGLEIDDFSVSLSTTPLSSLLPENEVVEDEPPPVSEGLDTVSKLGEVYSLGQHRLMCGDSTKTEDVEKLMGGKRIKTIFTSPPYNMGGDMYENYDDNLKSKEYIQFNMDTANTWLGYLDGYIFWNISYNKKSRWEFLEIMYRMVKETGMRFMEMIVWDKGHGIPITSKDMLTREYEDILLVGKEAQINRDIELFYLGSKYKRAYLYKNRFTGFTNYWRVVPNKIQRKDHSAIYPVMLPAKGIVMTTEEKDIVADPFGGSGSTLIACEQLDRTCYMMELDPKYCDVIRKRYHKFVTGNEEGWEENTPEING